MAVEELNISSYSRLSRHTYPVCAGSLVEETYGFIPYTSSAVKTNPAEHRPRPDNLLANLTNQEEQYTYRASHAYYEWGPDDGTLIPCDPYTGAFEFSKYEYWNYFICSKTPLNLLPGPLDWGTPMRLEIKDLCVNLGSHLAEYRQSVSMFSDAARGIRDAWTRYKRLGKVRRRGSLVTPCTVAASELITSYGVMPLISDVYNSIDALNHALLRPIERRFKVRVVDKDDNYTHLEENGIESRGSWRASDQATAYVRLHPRDVQLIAGNPLEVLWEGVPYSFVVDWMIPVGDFLSALDALEDVEGLRGTVTHKREMNSKQRMTQWDNEGARAIKEAEFHYKSHRREVFTEVPLPRVPRWDPSTSWKTLMHAMSLLTAQQDMCKVNRAI